MRAVLSTVTLVLVASALAQQATNMETVAVGPSGAHGQKFEYTTDAGETWKAWSSKTGDQTIQPLSSVGYRIKGRNATAAIFQNAIAPYSDDDGYEPYVWASYTDGPAPYNIGLAYNNVYFYTNFSEPASEKVSKKWEPITLPATLQIANSECPTQPFNATVFHTATSGLPPMLVQSPDGAQMQFDMADILVVDNITFSFGAYVRAGGGTPFLKWYSNVSKGPQTSARMQIYGGFCIDDD